MRLLLSIVLAGCIREVPLGPDLGPCAQPPDGTYTFGEIGIGTCLAGPADLVFFEQGDATLLAVSNADPYRNFETGSVLVLDWDALAERLEERTLPLRLSMHELSAWSLPIFDDDDGDGKGGNPYLGGMGYLADASTLMVTSRLTEGANTRSGRDEAWFVDTSALTTTGQEIGGQLSLTGSLVLEDDPFPVVVQPSTQRAFVGNLTDHSVTVLDTDPGPDATLPVSVIDLAPEAYAGDAAFDDADFSGSFAELVSLSVTDSSLIPSDAWDLTYLDATTWLFVPTGSGDDSGFVRHTSSGSTYQPSAFGFEDGLSGLSEPFMELAADGQPQVWAVRDLDQAVIVGEAVASNTWGFDPTARLSVPGFLLGSPSPIVMSTAFGLIYDLRDDAGDPASIALATSADGATYTHEGAVLVPPEGLSYEDPFATYDTRAGSYRMWLSVHDLQADSWWIALSVSDDGRTWSEPEPVLEVPGGSIAAPSVAAANGRYLMWSTLWNTDRWDRAVSWSWNGRTWTEPQIVVPGEDTDVGLPARAPALVEEIGAWRIEGRDIGLIDTLLPAGLGVSLDLGGFELAVSNGHLLPNDRIARLRADRGLTPGSVIEHDGRRLLYATTTGSADRLRIAVLEDQAGTWRVVVEPDARDGVDGMEEQLQIAADEQAFAPVVVADAEGLVMFYAVRTLDGTTLRRATSSDGLSWTPLDAGLLLSDEVLWDSVQQIPHSIESLADGTFRLWYTGDDGSRLRIGSATTDSLRGGLTRELGVGADYRLGTGIPGSFDDAGVKDPLAISIGGQTHLYYSGFDGSTWSVGHAVVEGQRLVRRTDPVSGLSRPAMSPQSLTFSALGIDTPVLSSQDEERIELLYAGDDGLARRTGLAAAFPDRPEQLFAEQRVPTAGDTLSFVTARGGPGDQVIELQQSVDAFATTGFGMSSLELDEERGFLYVTSKLDDHVYVIDVRDDSNGTFTDANVLDLEGLIRIDTGSGAAGFRSALVSPSRDLLFLTMRQPDGVVLVDLSRLTDDGDKELQEEVAIAFLPMPDLSRDVGVDTYATIGGAGMALTADERTLLVTHYTGNGLSAFDLDLGAWGSEIAWIRDIGEHPHVVRISPDGRWAVVANYLGELEGQTASGTLTVIDLDPESSNYLEIAAWLTNR